MLALLALNGEQSGYDLLKQSGKAIGQVWAPAKSQLYAVLPRLARDGLAEQTPRRADRAPRQAALPDHAGGRDALEALAGGARAGRGGRVLLKLFVGGLISPAALAGHVEQFRPDAEEQLGSCAGSSRRTRRAGNDSFHYFLLRLGIERAEHSLAWADWVL